VFISARADTYLNKRLMLEDEMITFDPSLHAAFSADGVSFFAPFLAPDPHQHH
jgi:hypothetical protein